jgi:hypothetical protein
VESFWGKTWWAVPQLVFHMQYYYADKIKGNMVGGASRTDGENEKTAFYLRNQIFSSLLKSWVTQNSLLQLKLVGILKIM